MKIYTITLNPAYDVHATAVDFAVGNNARTNTIVYKNGNKIVICLSA